MAARDFVIGADDTATTGVGANASAPLKGHKVKIPNYADPADGPKALVEFVNSLPAADVNPLLAGYDDANDVLLNEKSPAFTAHVAEAGGYSDTLHPLFTVKKSAVYFDLDYSAENPASPFNSGNCPVLKAIDTAFPGESGLEFAVDSAWALNSKPGDWFIVANNVFADIFFPGGMYGYASGDFDTAYGDMTVGPKEIRLFVVLKPPTAAGNGDGIVASWLLSTQKADSVSTMRPMGPSLVDGSVWNHIQADGTTIQYVGYHGGWAKVRG